ncbi:MAG: hypothetical protein LH468_03225 [Nocardioides sp.]|nr:hypothetical protein [Nocardioides sp.]
MTAPFDDLDPFDLPGWLGTEEVTWAAEGGVRGEARVPGSLRGPDPTQRHACDLLAVDLAYPTPVAPDVVRVRAHQAWQHHQVLLLDQEARLVLAVPGTGFTADVVLEALARLALAVGADAGRYAVHLQIGRDRR